MKTLLATCTTETPFRHPNGELYRQVDGVAMGSPLGPLFANYYMSHLENQVLAQLNEGNRPLVYCRFVDDIFVVVRKAAHLEKLKQMMQDSSILKFTSEIEVNKSISFLDTEIKKARGHLETSVHIKETNSGECMNHRSIAPDKYKKSVINSFLSRAYKVSSSWQIFTKEVDRISQMLVNNNFPQKLVQEAVHSFVNEKYTQQQVPTIDENSQINFFYKNQMTSTYKQEEKTLRKIVRSHVLPAPEKAVRLNIYYKNKKVSNLFIKNNPHKKTLEEQSHVVYRYSCNAEECNPSQTYIGYTTTTLKQRMTTHAQNGSIKSHSMERHDHVIRTAEILKQIKVIYSSPDRLELLLAEALLIKSQEPTINNQREGETRILDVFR